MNPANNRSLLASITITVGGLTIAEINAYLGCLSLVIGIAYQLWKWHRAYAGADKREDSE